MLLPGILGGQFQEQYSKAMSGYSPDFAFIDAQTLKDLLTSIVNSNNTYGKLSEHESVVNQFLSRALQLIQHGESLQDSPDVALSQWRALFELSVCFRVWTQTVTIEGRVSEFLDMAQRFLDYGKMERIRVYNDVWTYDEREIELKYRNLPKHLQLQNEYDWLNPAFREQELKRRPNKYHNSFRDVVARSKEFNWDLWNLLDDYVRASTVLHFNPISLDLASVIDIGEVNRIFLICLQALLVDYLSLIQKLYPTTAKTLALSNVVEGELRQTKRA